MRGRGTKQHRSSDGVPNRKGGSWPNHPSMRYELPIPFSPTAGLPDNGYGEGYCATFGHRPGCGHDVSVLKEVFAQNTKIETFEFPPSWPDSDPCPVCGEIAGHYLGPGRYTCETEPT